MKVKNLVKIENNDKQYPIKNIWIKSIAIYTFKEERKKDEDNNVLTPFEKARLSFSKRCFLFKSFITDSENLEVKRILVFNMPLEMISIGSYNQYNLIWSEVSKDFEICDYRFFCNIHDTLTLEEIRKELRDSIGNRNVFSRISKSFKIDIPLDFHEYIEKLIKKFPEGCKYKRPTHLKLWQGTLVSPYLEGWEREGHNIHNEF